MNSWLWNFIKNHFKKELNAYADQFKESHYRTLKQEHEEQKVYTNYPIETKVIVRSNEPEDLRVGVVTDYQRIGDKIFLVIEDSKKNTFIPSDNAPPYWTQERENALHKLNWAEQWNVMTKYYDIDLAHQSSKESPEYKNRKN